MQSQLIESYAGLTQENSEYNRIYITPPILGISFDLRIVESDFDRFLPNLGPLSLNYFSF
jgi:hypothetical protein